jgi:hypothetical protein
LREQTAEEEAWPGWFGQVDLDEEDEEDDS